MNSSPGIFRTHRYWLALALTLLALTLGMTQRQALGDFFLGPTFADLRTLEERSGHYLTVPVQGSEPIFFRAFTLGRPPYSWYAWLRVEGKFLLARLPAQTSGPFCTGVLQPVTSYERQYLTEPKQSEGGDPVLPLCLDATRPFRVGTLFLVVLPLSILLGMVGLLLRRTDPLSPTNQGE